jgi:hypothetical protein
VAKFEWQRMGRLIDRGDTWVMLEALVGTLMGENADTATVSEAMVCLGACDSGE